MKYAAYEREIEGNMEEVKLPRENYPETNEKKRFKDYYEDFKYRVIAHYNSLDFGYRITRPGSTETSWNYTKITRHLNVIFILTIATIVIPILIYQLIFFKSLDLPPSDGLSFGSCLIPRQARLPCGYGNIPANQCHSECCYDHTNDVCFHRFPSRFSYTLNQEWSEGALLTPRISTVPFGSQDSLTDLRLSIDEVSPTHLSLTFYKSDNLIVGRRLPETNYAYSIAQEELNIIVNASQGIIFTTDRGPIIAANDIWEIAFKLTNETMYGLDEIPLREDTVKVIYNHKGGLSAVPLIYAKSNGFYHGLLIETEAPTEINVRSENQLVVRSITNFGLKFHLFVGPDPVDIMKDVTDLIGGNKKLDYWMLGAHVCSELSSTEPLTDLETFINSANTHSLPFESHCGATPVVFNADCDEEQVKLINDGGDIVRKAGKKFIPHVSPYILYGKTIVEAETNESKEDEDEETEEPPTTTTESYTIDRCFDDEVNRNYLIQDPQSENTYIGVVGDYNVIYPKYDEVNYSFMQQLWNYTDFDGVILENNWPLDESEKKVNETYLYLPYFSEDFEVSFLETPQWNATLPERYMYKHNKYGSQFASAFEKLNAAKPTMTTTQWMNGDIILNRQDIETSWSSLQRELVSASLGGISGHRYWSSPICGDTDNFDNDTHTRLCAKWYMAASYFPLIKIHSKNSSRDPLAFVGNDKSHMIRALKKRMSLMPYLYTVLQEGPILRPMFYQFPSTESLANLTTQFSVGSDLVIVPNLQPSQSHVHFWLPPGQWYEFGGGLKINKEEGQAKTMTTTESDMLTFIRGGSVVIKQEDVKLTTAETQKNSTYTLIIALECETTNETETLKGTKVSHYRNKQSKDQEEVNATDVQNCFAKGKFYMSPEMTIKFEADAKTLTITAEGDDFHIFCDDTEAIWSGVIERISVYGLNDDKNNNDNYLNLLPDIKLCDLQTNNNITYELVD